MSIISLNLTNSLCFALKYWLLFLVVVWNRTIFRAAPGALERHLSSAGAPMVPACWRRLCSVRRTLRTGAVQKDEPQEEATKCWPLRPPDTWMRPIRRLQRRAGGVISQPLHPLSLSICLFIAFTPVSPCLHPPTSSCPLSSQLLRASWTAVLLFAVLKHIDNGGMGGRG